MAVRLPEACARRRRQALAAWLRPAAPGGGQNRCSRVRVTWGKMLHAREPTKVKTNWKMPLKIQVKIHRESDNPLENAAEQVTIHWKVLLKIQWNIPLKSTAISEVSIYGAQSFAPKYVLVSAAIHMGAVAYRARYNTHGNERGAAPSEGVRGHESCGVIAPVRRKSRSVVCCTTTTRRRRLRLSRGGSPLRLRLRLPGLSRRRADRALPPAHGPRTMQGRQQRQARETAGEGGWLCFLLSFFEGSVLWTLGSLSVSLSVSLCLSLSLVLLPPYGERRPMSLRGVLLALALGPAAAWQRPNKNAK